MTDAKQQLLDVVALIITDVIKKVIKVYWAEENSSSKENPYKKAGDVITDALTRALEKYLPQLRERIMMQFKTVKQLLEKCGKETLEEIIAKVEEKIRKNLG